MCDTIIERTPSKNSSEFIRPPNIAGILQKQKR